MRTSELEMVEVVGNFTGQKVGPIFFRGKDPIDGVWATPDVVITEAYVMPVNVCDRFPYFITDRMQSTQDCQGCGQEAQHYDSAINSPLDSLLYSLLDTLNENLIAMIYSTLYTLL